MGPPAKRRRLEEPEYSTDSPDAFDDGYDSDDELTLADLSSNDQRRKQALLAQNGEDVDERLERRQLDVTVDVASTVTIAVELGSDGEPTSTVSIDTLPTAIATDLTESPDITVSAAATTIPILPLSTPDVVTTSQAAPSTTQLPDTTAASNVTSLSSSVTAFSSYSVPFNGENYASLITLKSETDISIGSLTTLSTAVSSNMLIATNSSTNVTLPTAFLNGNGSLLGFLSSSSSVTTLTTSTLSASSSSSSSPAPGSGAEGGIGSGSGPSGATPTGSGSSGSGGNDSNNTPAPGLVAGAVTGSVGGTAIILLIMVILIRWFRRRNTAMISLPRDESSMTNLRLSSEPKVSQRSLLPAAATGALARLSTMANRKSSPTLPPAEQGFQKVSGRKMPSQFGTEFDHGPMSKDFTASYNRRSKRDTVETNLSDLSFYRDGEGFYGGMGGSPERPAGPLAGGFGEPSRPHQNAPSPENMRPSPARTPVIHQGGPWPNMAQTPPATAGSGTIGRSHQDSSHSTRFTEDM